MGIIYLNPSLYTLSAIILMVAAVGTFLKRTLLVISGKLLFSFLIFVLACCLFLLASEILPGSIQLDWLVQVPALSLIGFIPPLTMIGRLGLQSHRTIRSILYTWAAWISLYFLILPALRLLNPVFIELIDQKILNLILNSVLISGWIVMVFIGFRDFRDAIHNLNGILENKRARLWIFVWISNLMGGCFLIIDKTAWGLLFISFSSATAAYLLLAQDLPSPKFLIRQVIFFSFITFPLILLAWINFNFLYPITIRELISAGWLAPVINSVLWVICAYLIYKGTYWLLNKWFPITPYNLTQTLHEYSQQVSLLTSPGKLSNLTIDIINTKLGLVFGHIFEVYLESSQSNNQYRIQDSGGIGNLESTFLSLSQTSSILEYFKLTRNPILSEQLNRIIETKTVADEEKNWFTNPQIYIYVPIHTKDDWVGLMALGDKSSGESYTKDDLTLLKTLANQLSFSFQNARMVDTLMRINNDYRRTYAAMDQSNQSLQQAYNQLEKIDKTKSDFISVASHELRTPLTVMRGYNELLMEDPSINTNSYHTKMVRGMNDGMIRMQEVIESMLDVASIDSQTLRLNKESLSISEVINEVVAFYQSAAENRKISLNQEHLQELPYVIADREGLNKVFTQVITNAIKYTPDGGSVSISGARINSNQYGWNEEGVKIIVKDTGIGIEKDQLQLIFNKFYQTGKVELHSSGKTKYKGSGPGLGLAIAKGIINAHNGRIWAESSGHDELNFPGSEFIILLPLKNSSKNGI